MKLRTVGWLMGVVWTALGAVLLVPLLLALAWGEPSRPFALGVGGALVGGVLLLVTLRRAERSLDHRSAFLVVTLTWLSVCMVGTIPLAAYPDPELALIDALFETVSGFTTTGATVLTGLDSMPRSFLLWRAAMQWLGGMGIVILGVAILPLLGVGGMQLYKAEAPGPTKDKMTPRIAETAKLLWVIYLGLSVVAVVLFWATGMTLFDAVCHAMTSISTAGFSTHDASLGYWDSGAIHLVAIVIMIAGGTSFAVLWHALRGGGVAWSEHPELRAYVGILLLAAAVIAVDLATNMPAGFPTFTDTLEHAAFQAASILTTTGYSTRDFAAWPGLSQATLFLLFFVGSMAGSTGGGIKVVRIVLLARLALAQFFRLLHPHAFSVVRLGNRSVDDQILVSSVGFVGMWFLLLGLGACLITLHGTDFFSSLSAAAVTLGNIGPGLGAVGPANTFAAFDPGAKLVMAALMILGRLEIYTVLIILTPGFWRR